MAIYIAYIIELYTLPGNCRAEKYFKQRRRFQYDLLCFHFSSRRPLGGGAPQTIQSPTSVSLPSFLSWVTSAVSQDDPYHSVTALS